MRDTTIRELAGRRRSSREEDFPAPQHNYNTRMKDRRDEKIGKN